MPLTNSPFGLSSFGIPLIGSGPLLALGTVYFVDDSVNIASDQVGQGTDPTIPFKTLSFSNTQTTANKNDVVIVGASHSQAASVALALTMKASTTWVFLRTGASWIVPRNAATALTASATEQLVQRVTSTLPQTTTLNIFTIVNGPVLVREIFGVVTTAVQNQLNNTKLTAVATGLTAVDLCAVADIANLAVGTVVWITGTLATALQISANQTHIGQATPVVCGAGVIRVDSAASNTGAIQWFCRYLPLQPGAYMEVA